MQAVDCAKKGEVASGVWLFIDTMLATEFAIYFLPDIALYIPFRL